MSLNIKNERVHDLVREAARLTGKSQTSVVEEALRRYLDQIEQAENRASRDAELDQLLAQMRRELAGVDLHAAIEDLYDPDTGLPR